MVKSCCISIFILFSLFFVSPVFSQDQLPDPIPNIALPDEPNETQIFRKIELDSLLEHNVLQFCGQKIDMASMDRQRKLQREINSINPYSNNLIRRSYFFFPIIEDILNRCHIPDDFKYLMVIESSLNPYARSEVGAAGLWQFMKGTALQYGLKVDDRIDERFQIQKATYAACKYLRDAYNKFGDWVAAAQSYNIGQARIERELDRQSVDEAIDLHLVDETNRYIYRILAAKIIFTNPGNIELSKAKFYYKKIRRY